MTKAFAMMVILGGTAASMAANKIPAEWRARYEHERQMLTTRNFGGFSDMLAADYVWVQPDGKRKNRQESLAEFRPMFDADKIEMTIDLHRVTNHRGAYEVEYENRVTLNYKGKPPMYFHEIGTDTWRKVAGRWRFVRTVDKLSESSAKPFARTKP